MTNLPHPLLQALIPIAEGVAKTIGNHCEVAIHDFSNPLHSAIYVANGELLNRKVGDPLSPVFGTFIKLAERGYSSLINYGYYENGHALRCTKIFITDENKVIIGCFCINIVIDQYLESVRLMESICKTTPLENYVENEAARQESENAIDELVRSIILNSYEDFKKNGPMDVAAKKEFVQFLVGKGVFNVKGSVEIIAELLNVSKYTVYRYANGN